MMNKKELTEEEKRENRIDWYWAIYNTLMRRPNREPSLLYEHIYGRKVSVSENESNGIPFWNAGKIIVIIMFVCIISALLFL